VIGLFGGAFDPPHEGHVALLRAAHDALVLDKVIVLVVAEPAHKHVDTPPRVRLELARAAFSAEEVVLDDTHAPSISSAITPSGSIRSF
jgi:nicotinate-nucleotide adenylyltransferase